MIDLTALRGRKSWAGVLEAASNSGDDLVFDFGKHSLMPLRCRSPSSPL